MPKFSQTRLLPYSAAQMFDLVADVQSYPAFLPWCIRVERVSPADHPALHHDIDLTVGYKSFTDTFRSRVYLSPPSAIHVEYLGGSLKQLKTQWAFRPLTESNCEVDFFIDFSFGSGLLQFAVEKVFNQTAQHMIQAFEQRARTIYPHST